MVIAVVGLSVLAAVVARGWLENNAAAFLRALRIEQLPTSALALVSLTALLLFTTMLSISVRNAVQTLFERGDVDLLLSSPIDTRVVLAARGLWVFLSALLSIAVFIVPVAIGAAVFLGPRVLGVLPLLVSMALIGSGLGLLVTLALMRAIGARRARTVAQVVGVLLGAIFYLMTQVNSDSLPWLQTISAGLSNLTPDSPLLLPARAALFEPLPTLLMLALGALTFAGSVQLTHKAFLTGATSSIAGGCGSTKTRDPCVSSVISSWSCCKRSGA